MNCLQMRGIELLFHCAPQLAWEVLAFCPLKQPLNWQHAGLMRAPGFGVEIACRFKSRCDDGCLESLLRAVYDRTHGNAALRAQSAAVKHSTSTHAAGLALGAPAAQQLQSPAHSAPSFDEMLAIQRMWLEQTPQPGEAIAAAAPPTEVHDGTQGQRALQLPPHDALNVRLTWRYRRCLVRAAKSALRAGNVGALRCLQRAGWDIPAEQNALLLLAVDAAQPDAAQFLIQQGVQVQARAALCLEVAAAGKCLRTLHVLLKAGTAAQPTALRAGLVAAAGSLEGGGLDVLLGYIAQQRQNPDARWRGDVSVALADALRFACEGGQHESVRKLMQMPLHPGCHKWDASTLPCIALQPCPACWRLAQRAVAQAVDAGSAAALGAAMRGCQQLAPQGTSGSLWQCVGEDTASAALQHAAQRGFHPIVSAMVAQGVHEALPEAAHEAAAVAAQHGQVMVVWILKQCGIKALSKSQAPLIMAARGGHWQTLALLLAEGGDPSAAEGEALITAARYGHIQAVRLLLGLPAQQEPPEAGRQLGAAGAHAGAGGHALDESSAQMPADSTVFQLASKQDHLTLDDAPGATSAQALRSYVWAFRPCTAVHGGIRKSAALREACARGHTDVVHLLLQHGARADSVHNQALFRCMESGHVQLAEVLLRTGQVQVGVDELAMAQRSPQPEAMLHLLRSFVPE